MTQEIHHKTPLDPCLRITGMSLKASREWRGRLYEDVVHGYVGNGNGFDGERPKYAASKTERKLG